MRIAGIVVLLILLDAHPVEQRQLVLFLEIQQWIVKNKVSPCM